MYLKTEAKSVVRAVSNIHSSTLQLPDHASIFSVEIDASDVALHLADESPSRADNI